jgi:predicted transcriptional regulator
LVNRQKTKTKIEKPLTEVELEIMQAIWEIGECSIREVHDALPVERDLAYTTVATMFKILEQKKFLEGRKKEKAHTFRPTVSRAAYEAASLRHLKEGLFKNDPTTMVMRLLDETGVSQGELESIRKILEERLEK